MTAEENWYANDAATFGDRLAGAREQTGLTQGELAERLGVKLAVLEAWEQDLKEPRANRLQMLAGMLNISLSWLLTGQGEGPEGPPDEEPLDSDINLLLTEMRGLRGEIAQTGERLAQLEKRLRKALKQR
ncbi:helix-turn-helix domain-containing protein [Cognatiyoonia koreensis]|nr:helix-turn-helix transcriptional regulator [Cognatiyoonia koreensis]